MFQRRSLLRRSIAAVVDHRRAGGRATVHGRRPRDETLKGITASEAVGRGRGLRRRSSRRSYDASIASAEQVQAAVAAFVAAPTAETLAAAKQAWLTARDDYLPTEAFRLYGGPIDNPKTGLEGQINAWPLDEAYIDGVADDPEVGHRQQRRPTTRRSPSDVLVEANEEGGETNISTGWHAIEFLLWGQDTDRRPARPASGDRLHHRAPTPTGGPRTSPRRPTCWSTDLEAVRAAVGARHEVPQAVGQERRRRRSPTSCAASAR